jgi:hypothetical protein
VEGWRAFITREDVPKGREGGYMKDIYTFS